MASVPYRGRPGSPPTRPRGARRSVRREGGRVGGVGGRWDSADDGNNFQRMSWRGKEKKRWESKRERERERERERSGYPSYGGSHGRSS